MTLFKKNKEKSKEYLIGTCIINHNSSINKFINTLLYLYSPTRPISFVDTIEESYKFLEDLSNDFKSHLKCNKIINPLNGIINNKNAINDNHNDINKNQSKHDEDNYCFYSDSDKED